MLFAQMSVIMLAMAAPSGGNDAAVTVQPEKPKLICQVQEETGSRLGRKKVCRTADEWQDLKRETRMVTEKVQTQRATKY